MYSAHAATTSPSFEKTAASISPRKNENTNIATPNTRDIPIAQSMARRARCTLPAPIFCATKADTDDMKAIGISMINTTIFSPTPIAADSISPREFMIAVIIRNDTLVRAS